MRPPLVSLLCLPYAGASATMYLGWRCLLPKWIQVVPVELPGRGGRLAEALVEDFDKTRRATAWSRRRRCKDVTPCSATAWAPCWLTVSRSASRGRSQAMPRVLFALGSPAPSRRDPDRFANKDDDASLIADLRTQGGTPEEVYASAELLRIALDLLGADYRVCESFRHAASEPLPHPGACVRRARRRHQRGAAGGLAARGG